MVNLDHNKPFYKIEIFEPNSSNPKLIVSPNIYMPSERPNDDSAVTSEIYVSRVLVNTKLEGTVNTAEFELRHGIGNIVNIDLNHKVKIYFGFYYLDSSQGPEYSLAFTGYVTHIKNSLEKTNIYCKSKLTLITGKTTETTFSRMMGLNELIEQIAVQVGGLELATNGIYNPEINKQPGFGITNTQPLLEHVKCLAKYGGMFVFMNVFDKFSAQPWDPSQLQTISKDEKLWLNARSKTESDNNNYYKHEFIFDERLIDINFELTENKYSGVEVISLKPFSDEPVDSIEPVRVDFTGSDTDSSDKPKKIYKVSHVTREDLEKIAENLYWFDAGKIYVSVKLLSAPQVRVHDGVVFSGEIFEQVPFQNLTFNDGTGDKELSEVTFHVSEVEHRFDTVSGYITNVKLMISHIPAGGSASETGAEEAEAAEGELEDQELEVEEGEEAEAIRRLVIISRTTKGQIIPNAPFALTTPSGEEIRAETDDNGQYVLEDAAPGTYLVRFLTAEDLEEEEEGEGGGGLLDTVGDTLGGFL